MRTEEVLGKKMEKEDQERKKRMMDGERGSRKEEEDEGWIKRIKKEEG